MIENSNNRIKKVMNRIPQQYQEINEFDKKNTPKTKYYQNPYNITNKNNLTSNNSMNKQNVRMNMNMNINKNNMNNINNININNNNMNKINNVNNLNIKYNNMNNQNQNRNISNNQIQTNNINKALMVIKNEFKKKDNRIRELELKIIELENKINIITKSQNNNAQNVNIINLTQKKPGKNFTFSEKYSDEINTAYANNNNLNKTPEMNYIRGNNPFNNEENIRNVNNNFLAQTKSANQYKIKSNNDNDSISANKNNNLNDAMGDGSVFTGNSSNFQRHSKNEVKLYLKEVKSKVDPIIFKEFIQNIKLLTNSKEKNGVDKNSVIEKVRILFGEQFKDLFIKFQSILGFNSN